MFRKTYAMFVLSLALCSSAAAQVPKGFGPNPSFVDDFTGTRLDTTKWTPRNPGVRDNCINVPNSLRVHDGMLTITTFSETVAGIVKNYCGMISTQKSFLQKYGYWEARVRFHQVPGNQVAFWIQSDLNGQNLENPEESGVEIDVFEHVAEAGPTEYDHAIHWNGYGIAHKSWAQNFVLSSLNDGRFHYFTVAWTPDGYAFYVDSTLVHVDLSHVPVSVAREYVILSTLVPRKFPTGGFGSIDESQATFDVDYVKVYPYVGAK